MLPDGARSGILWMPNRAVAAAHDMADAFNGLSLALSAGVTPDSVIERVDMPLVTYGGFGLTGEIFRCRTASWRERSRVCGPWPGSCRRCSSGSRFLVNMVIGRIIALERSEIGLIEAVGYGDGVARAAALSAGGRSIGGSLGRGRC